MAKAPDEDIVLDKRFYVPPFVIDVRQEGDDDGEYNYKPGDVADAGPIIGEPGTGGGTNVPMAPTSFKVVQETVRMSPDGRAVVDLVLEFPDVQGVESIDVAMTKAESTVPSAPSTPPPSPIPTVPVNPPPTDPGTVTSKFIGLSMPQRGWFSGGAGDGITATDNSFGNWRGSPVDIISTWVDVVDGGAWDWGIAGSPADGDIANYSGLVDIAIGGPSSYVAAKGGSMDNDLRAVLQRIRANRIVGGTLRPTIIRPFHELNGNWYEWSVFPGGEADFKATARRWRTIANEVFPEAIWALCGNGETTSGISFANLYEDGIWDMIGVDRYNIYPYIGRAFNGTYTSWETGSTLWKGSGQNDPKGVEAWRQFAQTRGLPLYLPEYANAGGDGETAGDDPYWLNKFFDWVQVHKGKGAGKVFAESWFNIAPGEYEDNYWIYVNGNVNPKCPNVAEAYRNRFP